MHYSPSKPVTVLIGYHPLSFGHERNVLRLIPLGLKVLVNNLGNIGSFPAIPFEAFFFFFYLSMFSCSRGKQKEGRGGRCLRGKETEKK